MAHHALNGGVFFVLLKDTATTHSAVENVKYNTARGFKAIARHARRLTTTPESINKIAPDRRTWLMNGASSFYIERLDPVSDSYEIIENVPAMSGTNTNSDWSVAPDPDGSGNTYSYLVLAAITRNCTPDDRDRAIT